MKLPLCFLLLSLAAASCANKGKVTDRRSADQDTTFVAVEQSAGPAVSQAELFLHDLYYNYVFNAGDFDQIKDKFSASVIQTLRDGYEYDGEGYAVWLFRTGCQDGPSDVSKIVSVDYEGDGWYTVNYIDMGYDGTCRFHITETGNRLQVDSFSPSPC